MRLIFSGGWVSKKGLFEADVLSVEFFSSLEELPLEDGFYVFSYDLTSEVLGSKIKESHLPKVIKLGLSGIRPYECKHHSFNLRLLGSSMTEDEYKEGVRRVKEYIEEGVVYQINLTNRFDFELRGSPEGLFLSFFSRQPTPYAFFLDLEKFALLSGSMELFLEKRGKRLLSKPIKGTGRVPQELLNNSKEMAENLMITDMVRNDMGKIALKGSVKVEELFKVERYPTLCHMHSTVSALTQEGFTEIFKALFPPASVTGAPKVKAVEVIDSLERHARGYYCGCAGFVRGSDFTLSLLIRSALKEGERVSYFSGCGIVWDSDEEREWQELLLKMEAFTSIKNALSYS